MFTDGFGFVGSSSEYLVTAGDRWDRELVAHTVVDDQLVVEPPVILRIEPVVRVDLLQVANRFGSPFVGIPEQERGERTAAGVGEVRHTRNARLKEAESSPAADVLLAEAVGLLAIVGEAGLDRVRAPGEGQVVLDREPRLLGAVVRHAAPRRELGELDRAHVLVAFHRIRNADPLLPVLVDVGRERVLVERVHAHRQVIDDARAGPVPTHPVKVAVKGGLLNVVERHREPGGAARAGLRVVARPVEEVGDAMPGAQRVVDFHAVLVRVLDRAAVFGNVVVVDVPEGAGHAPLPVRDEHRARQRGVLPCHGAEAFGGNHIVGERIPYEPGAARIRPRGRRIVDRDPTPLAVDPIREVAVPHFGRGHRAERGVAALLVVKAFVRREEERAVSSVVQLAEHHRTTKRSTEVALLVDALRLFEEPLGVQRIMPEEPVGRALQGVRAGFRRERDAAAAGLAELRLEAVRFDRELGNRLQRWCEKCCFGDIGLPVRVDGHTIQRRAERASLAAPQRYRRGADPASGLRLGHRGNQIERAAHRAADHQRQLVNQPVRHRGRDLRVFGLQRRVLGDDVHGLGHRAEIHRDVDAGRCAGRENNPLDDCLPETFQSGLEPIGARRQVGDVEPPRFRRDDSGGDVCPGVDHFDRDARHGRLGLVCHDP